LAVIPAWIAAILRAMDGNAAVRSNEGLVAASEPGRGLTFPGLWVPAFPAGAGSAGTTALVATPGLGCAIRDADDPNLELLGSRQGGREPWGLAIQAVEWDEATGRESSLATTLYHNPRCSKSRAGLALLREQGIEPEVVEYLKHPPDADTLSALLDMLGLGPRELMRTKEPEYRALHLDDPALTREALIAAMVANPRLIERPILVKDGRAALGRPPEKLLEIL
jgi:arsenate reductase